MAVGGLVYVEDEAGIVQQDSTADTELVDVAHPEPHCKSPPNVPFPNGVLDGQITYFQGKVLFCSAGCYSLEPGAEEWTEFANKSSFTRVSAASSLIGNVWLISGGYTHGLQFQESSSYWDGSRFHIGPDIPELMAYHCQVTISETEVFFSRISKIPKRSDLDIGATFVLDWTSQEWKNLTQPETVVRVKNFGDCGKYVTSDGKIEIVSVGDGKSDIYSVDKKEWRHGPDYTPYTSQVSTVQVEGTFWVIGGKHHSDESVSDIIMKYELGPEDMEFKTLPQKLEVARSRFAALTVPKDFCRLPDMNRGVILIND